MQKETKAGEKGAMGFDEEVVDGRALEFGDFFLGRGELVFGR